MPVDWNAHRFSGGALALSAANTVVHRADAQKRFDRFDDEAELPRFAAAASVHCDAEFGGLPIEVVRPPEEKSAIVSLREATDRLFRSVAREGKAEARLLADLLEAGAGAIRRSSVAVSVDGAGFGPRAEPIALDAAMAISALALLRPETLARIKICPNCGWLFVDRSRNASRLWCDMAVCGNRAKARRHYGRAQSHKKEVRR